MKPNLSLAMANVDNDFSAEAAAADAAIEEAADELVTALENVTALETIQTEQAPTWNKQTRDWTDKYLATLASREEVLHIMLASADAEFEGKVAEAQAERDRIKAAASAELKDVTTTRAIMTLSQGELRKAEYQA